MSDADTGRWGDLRARVLSGLVMLLVGGAAVWLGGTVFVALVIVLCGVMIWELAQMIGAGGHAPEKIPVEAGNIPLGLALFAALVLLAVVALDVPALVLLLVLPALAGAMLIRRDRGVHAAYAVLVMLTGYGLITLRAEAGLSVILWLVLVVVTSDVLGYFAGRLLGGPKFWPAVSPKKTWSGTVAGWIGALALGAVFMALGQGGWGLLWVSPLVAFAGQLGDIAESAIKRRAGVKDSSHLIPGHGGVLDRFDALAAAVVLVFVLSRLATLPGMGI